MILIKRFPKYIIAVLFVALSAGNLYSQTSALGNYEVYSHKTSSSGLGFFVTDVPFSDSLNAYRETGQKGLFFETRYSLGDIAEIPLGGDQTLRFFTEGAFRAGFAVGDKTGSFLTRKYEVLSLKYYVGKLDAFSFNVGMEYTYVFNNGYAISLRGGVNIFNVGGTMAFREGGTFKDDAFGTIDIVPLSYEPSIVFDFGRTALGFSFYANPQTFVAYKILPASSDNINEKGLRLGDTTVKKFGFQAFVSF